MSAQRLDRRLSSSGERSRSEASRAVRAGLVTVNGVPARDPALKVLPSDDVLLSGKPVADDTFQYYLLYKPAGVLTAARDKKAPTVMDFVPTALLKRNVLPVGRLDKDTTGLLLLTNDGPLAHALLDPKRHVWKRYEAVVAGRLTEADEQAFADGVPLSDFTARPAALRVLEAGEEESRAEVLVCEGKFHQVKRMFLARGHEVLSLHRAAFGPLTLAGLRPGGFRPLEAGEVEALLRAAQGKPDQNEG